MRLSSVPSFCTAPSHPPFPTFVRSGWRPRSTVSHHQSDAHPRPTPTLSSFSIECWVLKATPSISSPLFPLSWHKREVLFYTIAASSRFFLFFEYCPVDPRAGCIGIRRSTKYSTICDLIEDFFLLSLYSLENRCWIFSKENVSSRIVGLIRRCTFFESEILQ